MPRFSANDIIGLVAMVIAAFIVLTIITFVNEDSVRSDKLQEQCIKSGGEWVDGGCRIK